jgi:hypothetical protein
MASVQKQFLPQVHDYRVGDAIQNVIADMLNKAYSVREYLQSKASVIPEDVTFIRPYIISADLFTVPVALPGAGAENIGVSVNGSAIMTIAAPINTEVTNWAEFAALLQTRIQALGGDFADVYVDFNNIVPQRITILLDQVAERNTYVLNQPQIDITESLINPWPAGGGNPIISLLDANGVPTIPGSTCEDAATSTKYVRTFATSVATLNTAIDGTVNAALALLADCKAVTDNYLVP